MDFAAIAARRAYMRAQGRARSDMGTYVSAKRRRRSFDTNSASKVDIDMNTNKNTSQKSVRVHTVERLEHNTPTSEFYNDENNLDSTTTSQDYNIANTNTNTHVDKKKRIINTTTNTSIGPPPSYHSSDDKKLEQMILRAQHAARGSAGYTPLTTIYAFDDESDDYDKENINNNDEFFSENKMTELFASMRVEASSESDIDNCSDEEDEEENDDDDDDDEVEIII